MLMQTFYVTKWMIRRVLHKWISEQIPQNTGNRRICNQKILYEYDKKYAQSAMVQTFHRSVSKSSELTLC